MTLYVALTADVIASRELSATRRAQLQDTLRRLLPALNSRWAGALAARFALTMGDELQCLLTTPGAIWEVSHGIRQAFNSVDWIIACGRGTLSTPLAPGIAAPELDGPCFHAARAALERGKAERLILALGGFDDPRLDGVSRYYAALYWGWTRRQRLAANVWRAAHVGALVGEQGSRPPHPSATSHLRRRMAWPLVESGDRMFQTLLEAS